MSNLPKGFKVIATPEEAEKRAHQELLDRANHIKPISGKKITYHVKPRFSPGSPAMVDFAIAKRVAWDEMSGHHRTLSGVYGDEQKSHAEKLGLEGIVYAMDERAECWIVTDLITGDVHLRMFDKDWKTPAAQMRLAETLARKYGIDRVTDYDGQMLIS